MSAHWDECLKLKTLFDTELRCPLQQDEYHMLHLVCASRTPPSSPKPPRSHSNKPQENSPGPTVGQRWLETSFHTFHHHHSTFHHPAHCCTPSLRFEGENIYNLLLLLQPLTNSRPPPAGQPQSPPTGENSDGVRQRAGAYPYHQMYSQAMHRWKKYLQIKNYHEVKWKAKHL